MAQVMRTSYTLVADAYRAGSDISEGLTWHTNSLMEVLREVHNLAKVSTKINFTLTKREEIADAQR